MRRLSDAANRLVGQKMFQILARAQELERGGMDILHFEIGDPDFGTPQNITRAACDALARGETHYTNSMGLLEFRQTAIEVTSRSRGFRPDLEQILVTPGANAQLYYAIACAVNPGEEIIIPDPSFVSYASIISFLGAVAVRVPLVERNEFRMNPADVEKAITPKTRMIIMNSPSNPTGAVMTEQEIREVYDIARRHGIYLLSDEIYARMVYEDGSTNFHSPSKYDRCRDITIVINGFSKSYAMTGWRLGVVMGPADLISKMGLLLETTTSCVSPFVQRAGIEALQGSQEKIVEMMREFRRRRDLIVNGLNTLPGVHCLKPHGAFYVFPNIQGTGYTSEGLAEFLLNQVGIAVSPGTIFGDYGEGYIRLCYANSAENIKRAIERMRTALKAPLSSGATDHSQLAESLHPGQDKVILP
jgi:aspartate aminotransferase